MSVAKVLTHILGETEAGRAVALCAIVATRGSTPQPAGALVCVDEAANLVGTLGGGCVEADIRRQAHRLLSVAPRGLKPAARGAVGELISVQLDHDFGYDDGMICGGQMDVAISVLTADGDLALYRKAADALRAGRPAALPLRVTSDDGIVEYRVLVEAEPTLLIVGAGHISRVLARMVAPLGFSVHVIDDRADYANAERFPSPIRTTVGAIDETLKKWPIDRKTYIVVVTRGHKHDEQALQVVLRSPAKYVGMIGSRRKVRVVFDDLRHRGATDAQLAKVHAPIGVDISAVTTEEIALSIAAQLVSVRHAERRKVVEGPIQVNDGAE